MKKLLFTLSTCMLYYSIYSQFPGTVEKYEKAELVHIDPDNLSFSSVFNGKKPLNKSDVYLEVTLTSPSNETQTINGFYFKEYNIVDEGTLVSTKFPNIPVREVQEISGSDYAWTARFAPDEEGTWTYSVKFVFPSESPSEYTILSNQTFLCTANTEGDQGFVYFDEYYRFKESGEPFHAIPMNFPCNEGWYANERLEDKFYSVFFERFHEAKVNYLRIWVDHYGSMFLIGKAQGGHYFEQLNLKNAYILDRVMEYADQYDINLQICMFQQANFSKQNFWEHFNTFNKNLKFNSAGNPVGTVDPWHTFLSNTDAKIHTQNYIKYIIDRWGYSPNIACWELFNEIDSRRKITSQPDEKYPDSDIVTWTHDMAAMIKNYDHQGRAVTSSLLEGGASQIENTSSVAYQMFSNANVDFAQPHAYLAQYQYPGNNYWDDIASKKYNTFAVKQHNVGIPFYMGEIGSYHGNSDVVNSGVQQMDIHGVTHHLDFWSTAFQGGFMPGMCFWWESFIDEQSTNNDLTNYGETTQAFSEFRNQLPPLGKSSYEYHEILPNTSAQNLRGYYFRDPATNKYYGWMKDVAFDAHHLNTVDTSGSQPEVIPHDYLVTLDPADKPAMLSTGEFSLPCSVNSTKYRIKWFDTSTGKEVFAETFFHSSGDFDMQMPPMIMDSKYGDGAFIIEPAEDGWEEINNDNVLTNILDGTEILNHESTIFYVSEAGTILTAQGKYWDQNVYWLNGNAPKMLDNGYATRGMTLNGSNPNEVFYVAAQDDKLYRLYYSSGWQYETISNSTYERARPNAQLHYSNGTLYYVRYDGRILYASKSGSTWTSNWLNPNAPKVKAGTDIVVVPELNSTIFYQGDDDDFYQMSWSSGSGWTATPIYTASLSLDPNSEIKYQNGSLFLVNGNRTMSVMYQSGGSWVLDWLGADFPKVVSGTGFTTYDKDGVTYIVYMGDGGIICRGHWSSAYGWTYERIGTSDLSNGIKAQGDLIAPREDGIMYHSNTTDKLCYLRYRYNQNFDVVATNSWNDNSYNVNGADGSDTDFLIHLDRRSSLSIRTCGSETNYHTKIQLFDANRGSAGFYLWLDPSCSYSSNYAGGEFSRDAGDYYVVVDGYNANTGIFNLEVEITPTDDVYPAPAPLNVLEPQEELKVGQKLGVYPNPSNGRLTIHGAALEDAQNVKVFNLTGSVVYEISDANFDQEQTNIDLSDLPSGTYLLQVNTRTESINEKIIISQ